MRRCCGSRYGREALEAWSFCSGSWVRGRRRGYRGLTRVLAVPTGASSFNRRPPPDEPDCRPRRSCSDCGFSRKCRSGRLRRDRKTLPGTLGRGWGVAIRGWVWSGSACAAHLCLPAPPVAALQIRRAGRELPKTRNLAGWTAPVRHGLAVGHGTFLPGRFRFHARRRGSPDLTLRHCVDVRGRQFGSASCRARLADRRQRRSSGIHAKLAVLSARLTRASHRYPHRLHPGLARAAALAGRVVRSVFCAAGGSGLGRRARLLAGCGWRRRRASGPKYRSPVFAAYFSNAPLLATVSFIVALAYTGYEWFEYGQSILLGFAALIALLWHRARWRYYHG